MTDADALPQPDIIEGAPHPRDAEALFGHNAAQQSLIDAINMDRLPHGVMITGPKGIGKATMAYLAAASILGKPQGGGLFGDDAGAIAQLGLDPSHPIVARIRAGSEPGLFTLKRPNDEKTGKLKKVIPVDEVRKLRNFFALSAGGNGRRVVIVDTLDDMNPQAANAILKVLEEPPAGAVLFLICNQPGRVLPTIRSRCQVIKLHPLGTDDLQSACRAAVPDMDLNPGLLALASGSVAGAVTLHAGGGLQLYETLVRMLGGLPNMDRQALFDLADTATARGNEGGMEQLAHMMDLLLSRLARAAVTGGDAVQVCAGERDLFDKLNPTVRTAQTWARLHHDLGDTLRQGMAANLDPSAMILDMGFKIEETAAQIAR
ncbi:MAG: DNA polymerase III subunit delta' [Planktomarina sp.]